MGRSAQRPCICTQYMPSGGTVVSSACSNSGPVPPLAIGWPAVGPMFSAQSIPLGTTHRETTYASLGIVDESWLRPDCYRSKDTPHRRSSTERGNGGLSYIPRPLRTHTQRGEPPATGHGKVGGWVRLTVTCRPPTSHQRLAAPLPLPHQRQKYDRYRVHAVYSHGSLDTPQPRPTYQCMGVDVVWSAALRSGRTGSTRCSSPLQGWQLCGQTIARSPDPTRGGNSTRRLSPRPPPRPPPPLPPLLRRRRPRATPRQGRPGPQSSRSRRRAPSIVDTAHVYDVCDGEKRASSTPSVPTNY